MKKFLFFAVLMSMTFTALADDRPISYDKLPDAARVFITSNFPDETVQLVTVDDDIVRPDYSVVFSNGIKVDFNHDGSLDKVEGGREGVPAVIVPVQIREYVERHYPGSCYLSYDVDVHGYEVELSNGMELRFNSRFALVEVDR